MPLALVLVLISGLFFGFCNGMMIAKAKLPPFIATLGTMMVSQGFGSIISNVRTMHYSPTYVGDWFRPVFYISGNFPVGAIWLLGAFIIAAFVLNKTRPVSYTHLDVYKRQMSASPCRKASRILAWASFLRVVS